MTLNRNRIKYQSEVLELIDWKTSLKLNCIDQHYTLFEDYCNELPTCVNLRKRKPDLYDDSWKCEFSKEEIYKQQFEDKVEKLNMWDIGYFYDFTFLMKNQVSHQLVDLLKFYKITDVKVLRKMLKQIVRKIILEFKILI
ncbi:unnamed protein product [Rhizophagus irregularis]|nr:unnamed protein product [Rhizophagus irregularis]